MSPKRAGSGPSMPGAIWLRRRPLRREGSEALTRAQIAAATVELLDQDGPGGLSLRRLAEALGVHATTLYWHVDTRDELLDLALDAVFAELAVPIAYSGDWTAGLRGFMHDLRAALLRHPWSGALASSRALLGPNALARSELVYATLVEAGFTGVDLAAAAAAITNLVIGSVAAETAWHHDAEAASRQAIHEHFQNHAADYPTLAGLEPRPEGDWQAHFTRSAEFLLTGLAATPIE